MDIHSLHVASHLVLGDAAVAPDPSTPFTDHPPTATALIDARVGLSADES